MVHSAPYRAKSLSKTAHSIGAVRRFALRDKWYLQGPGGATHSPLGQTANFASFVWSGWALESPKAEPWFHARVEKGGTRYLLTIPWWALPPETLSRLKQEQESEFPNSYTAELLVCSAEKQPGKKLEADPWVMRAEFLRLKQDTSTLLAFLNRWGFWGPTRANRPAAPEAARRPFLGRRLESPPIDIDRSKLPADIRALMYGDSTATSFEGSLNCLLPFEIWRFQTLCRDALKKPADEWLVKQTMLALAPRGQYPHYVLNVTSCKEALLNTITIDHLRKVKFRLCARPDCRIPYAVETQHPRKYCTQYCGHLESVRRNRREAKKLKGNG